jgi:ABC-type bacteriocin/lantibiotic exporter with double-glycine peptidase domain
MGNKNSEVNTATPVKRFYRFLMLEKKEILFIYFYAAISGLLYLSLPLGIQAIVSFLFGGLVSTSLVILIVLVVSGVCLNGFLQILQMQVTERIQRKLFTRFALAFSQRFPRLKLEAVDDYYLPELVNRFFDTSSLQKGISKILLDLPSASIQILFGLILLALYHPLFIAFGLLLVSLLYLIFRFTAPAGIATSMQESDYKYQVGHWLEEVARNVKTFKLSGNPDLAIAKTDELVSGYLDARGNHFKVLIVQYWAFVAFKTLITAALLVAGAVLFVQQKINIGQFVASEIIILTILNSVEKIITGLEGVYDILTSLEKIGKVLDKPVENDDEGVIISIENPFKVEVKNLSFSYPDATDLVLSEMNFEIEAGEKVAICGTKNSGKSTLLKLFTGIYENYSGSILINDMPISSYNLNELRSNMGVYFSRTEIFNASLLENLTLQSKIPNQDKIIAVLKEVGLMDFVQSNKEGLGQMLDTYGRKLSESAKSKILLCRALLKEPKLLLIDDFRHNLEQRERQNLATYITSSDKKYTLLIRTTDEELMKLCDRVLLVHEGAIVANGRFEEVSKTAIYSKCMTQKD